MFYNTKLERVTGAKHSNLLGQFISYEKMEYCEYVPCGQCYKTFYGRNYIAISVTLSKS
jgi:hypothetical protein